MVQGSSDMRLEVVASEDAGTVIDMVQELQPEGNCIGNVNTGDSVR